MAKTAGETPMMKQYNEMKRQHPDAILLFRCGDFYETFASDAVRAAEILGITLTKRGNGGAAGVELAGFPYHALGVYLPKLVRAGVRVAICDQLEDPKTTKTLVKRGVTELITPSVSYGDATIGGKENAFLASIHFGENNVMGIALLDMSTGEFLVSEGGRDAVGKILGAFDPKEVIFQREMRSRWAETFQAKYFTFTLDEWVYNLQTAEDRLKRQFGVETLKGFGIEGLKAGIVAAGAALCYLDQTHHTQTDHIRAIRRIDERGTVWLDPFTVRNLELYASAQGERERTLLGVLDRTKTPMGTRMMRRWVGFPLVSVEKIRARHEAVGYLKDHAETREDIGELLLEVGDLERLAGRVAVGRANPRETSSLGASLRAVKKLKTALGEMDDETLAKAGKLLNPCEGAVERIEQTLVDEPPIGMGKGAVVREGVSVELDELRALQHSGKAKLEELAERAAVETGIPNLKVSFNNVFGYYIEVRNTHKDKVPEGWIRKQTLTSAERYVTEELKAYEQKIMGAEERIGILEERIYAELVEGLKTCVMSLQMDATLIAQVDCLASLAEVAEANGYVKPEVNEGPVIDIRAGRHPVIETGLPPGKKYVPNDVKLDNEHEQILIITGPNMAGKSALLRQTALIVLMAQMGGWVPAEQATIGMVDKIFTRVGASDNISAGESTFMVEMNEASSILNNATERSLILFDELGRGTSTYDGISIAWAIVEYLHEKQGKRAKTLFATHYHELNDMAARYERIRNYNVSVREEGGRVIFLRKLVAGGAEHSFGIHVARIAGMPDEVTRRADEVLAKLEQAAQRMDGNEAAKSLEKIGKRTEKTQVKSGMQMSFFQLDDPVLEQVRDEILNLDIDNLTPREAMERLYEIKKIVKGGV